MKNNVENSGDINGKGAGALEIPPEQFTRAVWDFIFLGKPIPDDDPIVFFFLFFLFYFQIINTK